MVVLVFGYKVPYFINEVPEDRVPYCTGSPEAKPI